MTEPTRPETTFQHIDRHLKGERVTTEYIDLTTHKLIHVPMDETPPPNTVPLLGEVSG